MYELVPDSDSQILEESRSFIEPVNYSKKKQSTSRFIKPAIAFLSISVVITLRRYDINAVLIILIFFSPIKQSRITQI